MHRSTAADSNRCIAVPFAPNRVAGLGAYPRRNTQRDIVPRHNLYDESFLQASKRAVCEAGITEPATTHMLRQSFATHLWHAGSEIRNVQEHHGHAEVAPPMIYTQVLRMGGGAEPSPLAT